LEGLNFSATFRSEAKAKNQSCRHYISFLGVCRRFLFLFSKKKTKFWGGKKRFDYFFIYPVGSAGGCGIELPPEIIELPSPENKK